MLEWNLLALYPLGSVLAQTVHIDVEVTGTGNLRLAGGIGVFR